LSLSTEAVSPLALIKRGVKLPDTCSVGHYSIIESGDIGEYVTIGPYTHVMEGSIIGDSCHLEGCFIEGAEIGTGSRVYRNAHLMKGAVLGKNCLIGAQCFIADGVQIGNGVRMMLNVGIGRLITIGDNVRIGPNVVFSNANPEDKILHPAMIGEGAFIGTNVVTTPGVSIGSWAEIGAGAVVTRDVPPGAVMVGNPAKVIRQK
jgi:acetyltransferase-like isoleucine patch superfamily enzyme